MEILSSNSWIDFRVRKLLLIKTECIKLVLCILCNSTIHIFGVKVQTKIYNHKMILYFLCERLYERTKTDHMHGIEEANLLPLAQKQNQFLVRINCEPETQ